MEEYCASKYVGKCVCVVFECACKCLSVTGTLCCITEDYFIVKDCCCKVYHITKDNVVYFTCCNPCCNSCCC